MKLKLITEKFSPTGIILTGIMSVIMIGALDLLTGYQISFSIFYLVPIMAVTWRAGKLPGILISFLSTVIWIEADLLAEHFYTHSLIPYWNGLMRFGMFILVAFILSALKQALSHQTRLARIDPLTGVSNMRAFIESLKAEIERSLRYQHPISVAYLDLDNFKNVNDTLGHQEGDELLLKTAAQMQKTLRRTDLIGRLGGDEFAILLRETGSNEAREVLNRTHQSLTNAMKANQWPVTFSIGCVTYHQPPDSVDRIIRAADDLMYQVKSGGKNNVNYLEIKSDSLKTN